MKYKILYLLAIGIFLSGCHSDLAESSFEENSSSIDVSSSESVVEPNEKEDDSIDFAQETDDFSSEGEIVVNSPKTVTDTEETTVVIPTTAPTPNVPKDVATPKPESTPMQTPISTPKPEIPSEPTVCSNCIDKSKPCDAILDTNYYRETFSNESDANSKGMYYLDEVMYIGDDEITNYSVQPVYNNHRDVVYYGLNLWSSGKLIE